jgi:GntR family transcriptional regulator, transcriptional repressor for pyruvate dehydrogenase complex
MDEAPTKVDEQLARAARRSYLSVVEELSQLIQAGTLPVGAQLPSERELARKMKASRTTVRRALRTLTDHGVIESRTDAGPRSGSRVRHDLVPRDLLGTKQPFDWEDVSEILIARRLFEPQVAQVAGFVATGRDLAELERIIELQRRETNDVSRLRELDASFHLALARATHNSTIVAMIHTLLQRLRPAPRPELTEADAQELLDVHIRTSEAIASRDPARITAAMDDHLGLHERFWEKNTGRKLRQVLPGSYRGHLGGRVPGND